MAAADAGTIPTVRTQHHWARTHSASEWLKTRDAITWIPSKDIKKKTFKDFKRKVFLMRGKCSRLTAILAHEHVEGQVFFSCLASLSGFLKDAKSVYLKQRLLACVKRRLTLYIRLLFILLLYFVLLFFQVIFISHELWTGTHILFSGLIIYFDLNVLCKRSFMKKCEYIHAQISSLLHVYKCVCTCIFVCVWIYV